MASAYGSTREAAAAKGMLERRLTRWCMNDLVPALRVGSIYLIDRLWFEPSASIPPLEADTYSTREVAQWLGVSESTVKALTRLEGPAGLRAEAVTVGGRVVARRIPRRSIRRFLADNSIGPDVEDLPPAQP